MNVREMSMDECEDLLRRCRYGRLALSYEDRPYVIPMSYVYADKTVILHSRPSGKKIGIVRRNSNVCFEVDELEGQRWRSVIVYGKAQLSGSQESKRRMFDAFVRSGIGGHGGKMFTWEMLERMDMCVWEIKAFEITGREGIW
ncbi:MAG: pyridoxamine 5'-phosphate oxidase family protein [Methanothrix sp.]|nr:pyridoxamine 5'-phosphate oxidase family protein [Methanothrix sp.]MCX8206213.1 pyridoxamine 5'-phosphate oxidase family protein [Methanothrix sp.]